MSLPRIYGAGPSLHAAASPLSPSSSAALRTASATSSTRSTLSGSGSSPCTWNTIVSYICYLPKLIASAIYNTASKIIKFVQSFFTSSKGWSAVASSPAAPVAGAVPAAAAFTPPVTSANLPDLPLTDAHKQAIRRILATIFVVIGPSLPARDPSAARAAIAELQRLPVHPLRMLSYIYSERDLDSIFAKIQRGSQEGQPLENLFIDAIVARLNQTHDMQTYADSFAARTTGSDLIRNFITLQTWRPFIAHLANPINRRDYEASALSDQARANFHYFIAELSLRTDPTAPVLLTTQQNLRNTHPFQLLSCVYHSTDLSFLLEDILEDDLLKQRFMDFITPLFVRAKATLNLLRFSSLYASNTTLTNDLICAFVKADNWEELVRGAINTGAIPRVPTPPPLHGLGRTPPPPPPPLGLGMPVRRAPVLDIGRDVVPAHGARAQGANLAAILHDIRGAQAAPVELAAEPAHDAFTSWHQQANDQRHRAALNTNQGAGAFYKHCFERHLAALAATGRAADTARRVELIASVENTDPEITLLLPKLAVESLIASRTAINPQDLPALLRAYIPENVRGGARDRGYALEATINAEIEVLRSKKHQPGADRDPIKKEIADRTDYVVGCLTQGNANSAAATQIALQLFGEAHPET